MALTIAPLRTALSSFILTQLRTYNSPPPGTPLGGRSARAIILALRTEALASACSPSRIVVDTDKPEWDVWPR